MTPEHETTHQAPPDDQASPEDQATRRVWADRLRAWDRRSLIISLVLVGVGGLGYCLALGTRVRFPDESEYLRLSQHVADSGSFSLDGVTSTAFRAPGYAYVMAFFRELGAPVVALRFLNFVCLGLVVWAAWWLARRIGGRVAATITAPVVALYPVGFYTAGAFYPQLVGAAFLMGGLVALVQIPGGRRPYLLAIAAGLAFGALLVTVPPFWFVVVAGVIWLAVRGRRAGLVATVLVVAAVLPMGWMARNAVVMKAPVPSTTNNGINLLLGNSENVGARSGVSADITAYTDEAQRRGLDEVDTDTYLRSSAVHWITSHPAAAATLYLEKTVNYFAPFDKLGTESESSGSQQALATVCYLPLLALFVVRLARWRRDRPGEVERLLIILYLVAAPVQAVFVTRVRYRVPLEPLMIAVLAAMIARWLGERGERDEEPSTTTTATTTTATTAPSATNGRSIDSSARPSVDGLQPIR